MGFGSFLKNVVTLGASGRIEDAMESYKDSVDSFNMLMLKVEKNRVDVNSKLEQLINIKRNALISLQKIKKISKSLTTKERQIVSSEVSASIDSSFKVIHKTITAGELAMNSVKGAGIGVSTAMGAWALAGTLGTASTGTAITALSGAAATNATLAYLGGGAAAFGGGGMAAGTAVLGGLVALPAIILTGVFSHVAANKKIKELEEKEYEIAKASEDCEKALVSFELITKRTDEIIIAIEKSRRTFESELDRVYGQLYPKFYSKYIKALRKIFTGKYFNDADLELIKYIGGVATSLALLIDQRLFDEHGHPV